MTTVQLEGSDIQKFLDMAMGQFNLKVKIIDNIKFSTSMQNKTNRWDKIDQELRGLKTIDTNAGKELAEVLTLAGKGVEAGDSRTARDEYLTGKYNL